MDLVGTENFIFIEEAAYSDLKNETEEFLMKMIDEHVGDFKDQLTVMFNSLQQSFTNVSITQRHLNETKDKLKRNIRNQNEIKKSIEDDLDKLNGLKNDYEYIFTKVENAKCEETEKDKEIKLLNEEIVKITRELENETIQETFTQEDEIKKKLMEEEEDLKKDRETLKEKLDQHRFELNEVIIHKSRLEEESKYIDEENESFKKKLEHMQSNLLSEKQKKKEMEENFEKMKKDNQTLKETYEKLKQDRENLDIDIENFVRKKEDELLADKNTKLQTIQHLKTKKIPDLKKKISEYEKKIVDLNDPINKYKEIIREKEDEKKSMEKTADEYRRNKNANYDKIKQIQSEIDKFAEQRDTLKSEINEIDEELDSKKNEFNELKNETQKLSKDNEKHKIELEKLNNEIADIHNQNITLQNTNHRYINEHFGIKKESQVLEYERDNIEREKNLYAKQASDANMEHTQALEKLKNLTEAINELKAKNSNSEQKLKQQKKIYEALKADCLRFAKKYQETQVENQDLSDEKEKMEHKLSNLKIELTAKQQTLQNTIDSLSGYIANLTSDDNYIKSLTEDIQTIAQSINKFQDNNNNLKKMIAAAENDRQLQQKEYQIVVNERDFLGQKLIKRNEEITALYEKIKVLQLELTKLHSQFEKKLIEIEKLKANRNDLIEEFVKAESIIRNIFELKVVKIKLEKELILVKNKVSSLTIESRRKLNIHRWTKLEYSDPEKYELISQINALQKRLIAKTEEVNRKEELIQEKEKLYVKLKTIVARQTGADMDDALVKYQKKIKEETDRLKKMKEEIKSYRMTIRNYEYEIKRIDGKINGFKQQWFELMKKNMQEALQPLDEYPDEENNPTNDYQNDIDNDIFGNNEEYLEYYKNKLNSA
jgi:chromosome segregation ATPase